MVLEVIGEGSEASGTIVEAKALFGQLVCSMTYEVSSESARDEVRWVDGELKSRTRHASCMPMQGVGMLHIVHHVSMHLSM